MKKINLLDDGRTSVARKTMHDLLDRLGLERISAAGEPMNGIFARLTFGWVWTDDPELAEAHEEQDRLEGRC